MFRVVKENWYFSVSVLISFIVSFWMWYKSFFSGYPGFFIGNVNSINGLENLTGLWWNVNFGETIIQNSWQVVLGKIYLIIFYLGIDTLVVATLINFFILLGGFIFIKKLFDTKNIDSKIEDIYILLVAIGFLFSTFTLMFYEFNILFAYLFWMFPMYLYFVRVFNFSSKSSLIVFFYTLFATCVNLPFGLFAFALALFYLILLNESVPSKNFIIINLISIMIGLFPSLVYTILNLQYTSGVLASETFYRNSTNALSVLRGITDWGFFSGYSSNLYRNYSPLFDISFGKLTSLSFLIPFIIVVFNKYNFFKNSYLIIAFFIVISLIIGDKYIFTSYIYSVFESLPMSGVFRNNSKFYFLIYGIVLLMFVFNKNIKLAGYIFFISALPILWISINGNIIQSKSVRSYIFNDYNQAISLGVFKKEDNTAIFPYQYIPVYFSNDDEKIKIFGAYSIVEFYLPGNIIYSRCMGCGNPIFKDDLKIISDINSLEWENKIKEYGINKLVYDGNVFLKYYPGTLSLEEFDKAMSEKNIKYEKFDIGKLRVYSLYEVFPKQITMCDPAWFKTKNSIIDIERECKPSQKYFYKSDNAFYLPNVIMYLQLVLIIIIVLYLIYKKYEKI